MVNRPRTEQWSPASWPLSFKWRLLAAAAVLAATLAAIFALSSNDRAEAKVPVVVASQRWVEGHPPGEQVILNVSADLAALLVRPSDLTDKVAAVDVPEGTLLSPKMLRQIQKEDSTRATALMQFSVSADLWPDPGPTTGRQAVFSPTPGGCAVAISTLLAVADDGAAARVTVETDPELAAALSDRQWWIWESPPGGWPECESEEAG